eukprot:scaffold26318_cov181-Cylindrotheca_fusiformis.AAC.1
MLGDRDGIQLGEEEGVEEANILGDADGIAVGGSEGECKGNRLGKMGWHHRRNASQEFEEVLRQL